MFTAVKLVLNVVNNNLFGVDLLVDETRHLGARPLGADIWARNALQCTFYNHLSTFLKIFH